MSAPARFGRYRVERRIGSGAFATVWLAQDEVLEAPVAVKVLADNWAHRLDIRSRFEEEARILRRADSDRVVRVHDIGELEDGRPYFVMTYADRGTLAERLADGPLTVGEALRYGADIARGLAVLHQVGVIHRDVNPGNILLRSGREGAGERVLIADLGLAKAAARGSGFTLTVGTPGYTAPEQATPGERGLDRRADVYSIGAVLHHMLTGVTPKQDVPPLPARRHAPDLPEPVEAVVRQALATRREDRFPSAGALADALDAAAVRSHEAPPHRPARPVPPLPPSLLPRPLAAAPVVVDRPSEAAAEPAPTALSGAGPDVGGESGAVPDGPVPDGPDPAPGDDLDAADPTGAGPAGDRPAGSAPGPDRRSEDLERLAAEDERPSSSDDTLTLAWPPPRRSRRRLVGVLLAVLLLVAGGIAGLIVVRGRAPVRVATADGTVRLTVPAAWGKQLRLSDWDLSGFGVTGPTGTALLVGPDLRRRDAGDDVPSVFAGRADGIGPDEPLDLSRSADCPAAPPRPLNRSGLDGTVTRKVCPGSALAYVEAVLQPPDDSFTVYVQVREPVAEENATKVLDSLVVDWG